MKLETAIEILHNLRRESMVIIGPTQDDALRLGIEALKFVNAMGECPYCHVGFTLPGESEE